MTLLYFFAALLLVTTAGIALGFVLGLDAGERRGHEQALFEVGLRDLLDES